MASNETATTCKRQQQRSDVDEYSGTASLVELGVRTNSSCQHHVDVEASDTSS